MYPEYSFWIAPNQLQIEKLKMVSYFTDLESLSNIPIFRYRYWSTLHVSMITGSGIMTIFIYKGFDKKLSRLPSEFCYIIRRLEQVRDTKFRMAVVSNE